MPFQRLLTIACRHRYFAGQPCQGIQVQPTPACIRLMQRYRLQYRQEGEGSISVLKEVPALGKSVIPDCREVLNFYLLANDPAFFSFTSLKIGSPGNMIVFSNNNKPDETTLAPEEKQRWAGVAGNGILFGGVSVAPPLQFTTYTFSLDAPSLPWQYFVVAKNAADHYKVEGAAAGIVFQPVTDTDTLQASPAYQSVVQAFPNVPVYWYRSETPLPLTQQVRSRIQLINTDTQTILVENLPNPAPADNGVKMIYL